MSACWDSSSDFLWIKALWLCKGWKLLGSESINMTRETKLDRLFFYKKGISSVRLGREGYSQVFIWWSTHILWYFVTFSRWEGVVGLGQESGIPCHQRSLTSFLPPHIHSPCLVGFDFAGGSVLWEGKDVLPNLRFEFICSHCYCTSPCSIKQAEGWVNFTCVTVPQCIHVPVEGCIGYCSLFTTKKWG